MKVRTILIYDKRSLSAETVQALLDAPDGSIVALETIQFESIKELHLFEPEVAKLAKAKGVTKTPKKVKPPLEVKVTIPASATG